MDNQTNTIFGRQFNSFTSFDQLQLEDDLSEYWQLFYQCSDFAQPEPDCTFEDMIVSIYINEIREPQREHSFEEFVKESKHSEDLKIVNIIQEMSYEKVLLGC
jgi:hypothetical protein